MDSGFDFWGAVVHPGKVVKCTIHDALLHVTSICLGETVQNAKERSIVSVTHEGRSYVIASLREGVLEQVAVDLVFKEGVEFRFKCTGKAPVHLVGYVQPIAEEEENDDEVGEEEWEESAEERDVSSSEESEEEVEMETPTGKKRPAETKTSGVTHEIQPAKKVKVQDGATPNHIKEEKAKKAKALKSESDTKPKEMGQGSNVGKKEHEKAADKKRFSKADDKKEQEEGPKVGKKKSSESKKPIGEFRKLAKGLRVRDVEIGVGKEAKKGSRCSMYYTGKLKNGKVFDSNAKSSKPFSFKLGGGQVISGWELGIVGMKVGGKRQLIVPPKLGYGSEGCGSDIPPNSVLIFEVELARVN
jgi:FK506-binding nuclear protein